MVINLDQVRLDKTLYAPIFTLKIDGHDYTRESFLAETNGYIPGIGAYQEETVGGIVNWTLAICKTGQIVFDRVVNAVDLFLVGCGEDGGAGYHTDSPSGRSCGGPGGKGGKTKTYKGQNGVALTQGTGYSATVSTSTRTETALGAWDTSGGTQKSGGTGAYAHDGIRSGGAATPGDPGTPAFGDGVTNLWAGWTYGNGGGAGGTRNNVYYTVSPSSGGDTTAADGGAYNSDGGSARANTGDGGGGGGYDAPTYTDRPGGTGGSGIIMIRNAR